MPTITDPDDLTYEVVTTTPSGSFNISFITGTEKVQIRENGSMDSDGVTNQCVFSYMKELWISDSTLNKFLFPMLAIDADAGKFAIGQNDVGFSPWGWEDDTSRDLLRNGACQEYTSAGVLLRDYLAPFSGSGVEVASVPYFFFANDSAPTAYVNPGPVNQMVQTFGDVANGNFDKRGQVFTHAVRTFGNKYSDQNSNALPQLATGLKTLFAPLTIAEEPDLKINESIVNIDSNAPYTGMSVTFFASPQSLPMGGSSFNFGIDINANGGTDQQVYNFVQRALIQTIDIDGGGGTVIGQLSNLLLLYVGETLQTLNANNPAGGGTGVYISNLAVSSQPNVIYSDNTATNRTFPFISAGNLKFNPNLTGDTAAAYWCYFTNDDAGNNAGADYGTVNATLVNDNSGSPITGVVSGTADIPWDFDFDNNDQRGSGSEGAAVPVTFVALGLQTGKYVVLQTVMSRAVNQDFNISAGLELNYLNAA